MKGESSENTNKLFTPRKRAASGLLRQLKGSANPISDSAQPSRSWIPPPPAVGGSSRELPTLRPIPRPRVKEARRHVENHSPAGLTRAARGPWAEHLHRRTGSQGAAFHTEPPQAPTPGSAPPYHHPSGPKPGVGPLARMQSPRPCPRHPLGLSPQHRISHTRWS